MGPTAGLSVLEKKNPLAGTMNRTPDHQCTDYVTPGSNSLDYKEKTSVLVGSVCNPISHALTKKYTGSIYDCTVNDVITSYMHTTTISSHQRYSRMIKGAHSLRLFNMSPRPGPQTVTSRVAVWQLRHLGHPAVTSCLTLARPRCGSYVI